MGFSSVMLSHFLMIAAIPFSAAVATASIYFIPVFVMIATNIGVVVKVICKKCFHCRICIARYTTVQLDSQRRKCHLRTASNTAADNNIDIQCMKNIGKCTVSLTVCVNNAAFFNFTLFNIINLKLLGMTEMLEDFTVFVSYSNSHNIFSFFNIVFLYLLPFGTISFIAKF